MADRTRPVPAPRSPGQGSTRGAGASRGPRRRSRRGWLGRILGALAVLVLTLALLAGIGGIVFYNRTTLPNPNTDFQTNTTFMYYRDGKTKLGSFAVQNRQTIEYRQMPESIKDAVVAAENRTFWTDRGISPTGIARSIWTIVRGGEMQGGSTITQQYIKILYLSSDRTMTRKLKELALAVKMGKEVPKEEILEGYLNTIYFGRGAYGVQAASRSYFNIDAGKLTVPQAAVLASVLNNPSIYDPSAAKGNTARLLTRYRYVLDGMLTEGHITQAQHDQYAKALPTFPEIPLNQRWAGTRGYLLKMVQNELLGKGFTQNQIDGGGLQITTTFDSTLQQRAVSVGNYYTRTVGANAGGSAASKIHPTIASVQVGTGEVLALFGGQDYIKNSRNWALTDRPAASTFKSYAAIAGLRGGLSLDSYLEGNTFTPKGDSTTVRNEFSRQYGPVKLRYALQESINTAMVDMTQEIPDGANQVIKAANDAGVPKGAGWDANNRISLGMAEVSPLENAGGYATLANDGVQVANHVVKQVSDASGKVLYKADAKPQQAIEKDIARDVSSALEAVVNQGTGAAVSQLGFPVAGKTGTNGITRNGEDIITSAWFVAYTRQISTAVMYVAGDDGNQALDPYKRAGDQTFFGGTYPAQTWADFMKVAQEGLPVEEFPPPANVNNEAAGNGTGGANQPAPQPTGGGDNQPAPPPTTEAPSPSETSTDPVQPSEGTSTDPGTAPSATQTGPGSQPSGGTDPTQPQPTQTQVEPTQTQPPAATTQPQPTQAPPTRTQPTRTVITQPTQPATTAAAGGTNS